MSCLASNLYLVSVHLESANKSQEDGRHCICFIYLMACHDEGFGPLTSVVHSVCEFYLPRGREPFKGKKSDFCFITSAPLSLPIPTL